VHLLACLPDKSTTLILCSADLIGLFYEEVQKIRGLFAAEAPVHSWLIVACTHFQEGPDKLGLWGPLPTQTGVDRDHQTW